MTLKVLSALQRVTCAMFPLKDKHWVFFEVWTRVFYFRRDEKIISRCYLRCVMSNMHKKEWVYLSNNKIFSFCDCRKCKACLHVLNTPFMYKKPTIILFVGDGTHWFWKRRFDFGKQNLSAFLKKFFHQPPSSTPELVPKRQKSFHLWHNRVDSPLVDTVNKILCPFSF